LLVLRKPFGITILNEQQFLKIAKSI